MRRAFIYVCFAGDLLRRLANILPNTYHAANMDCRSRIISFTRKLIQDHSNALSAQDPSIKAGSPADSQGLCRQRPCSSLTPLAAWSLPCSFQLLVDMSHSWHPAQAGPDADLHQMCWIGYCCYAQAMQSTDFITHRFGTRRHRGKHVDVVLCTNEAPFLLCILPMMVRRSSIRGLVLAFDLVTCQADWASA